MENQIHISLFPKFFRPFIFSSTRVNFSAFTNETVDEFIDVKDVSLTYDSMSIANSFDTVVDFRGTEFKLSGQLQSSNIMFIKLSSMDFTERWEGEFAPEFIEDITQKAGSGKKLPIFWRMLCNSALKISKTVELEVFLPSDLHMTGTDEKVYLILTLTSEFDRVKYPLQLIKQEVSNEELIDTVKRLYNENLRLKERIEELTVDRSVSSLEQKIAALTDLLDDVQHEKDDEIHQLKRRLRHLQTKEVRSPSKSPRTPSPEKGTVFDRFNRTKKPTMRHKHATTPQSPRRG